MRDLIFTIIGVLAVPVSVALLAKINVNAAAKLLSKGLMWILKDEKKANKVENAVADTLERLARAIRGVHPDS